MTIAVRNIAPQFPQDPRTGLTLPLSKSLASPDLAKHRAVVAVELEVLAKKLDRFGWERDRGSAAHDRLMIDWMDALQDYPIEEIRAACRAHILKEPNRMPNEGHVVAQILEARRLKVAALPKPRDPEPERRLEITEEERARRAAVVASLGLKRIGGEA